MTEAIARAVSTALPPIGPSLQDLSQQPNRDQARWEMLRADEQGEAAKAEWFDRWAASAVDQPGRSSDDDGWADYAVLGSRSDRLCAAFSELSKRVEETPALKTALDDLMSPLRGAVVGVRDAVTDLQEGDY